MNATETSHVPATPKPTQAVYAIGPGMVRAARASRTKLRSMAATTHAVGHGRVNPRVEASPTAQATSKHPAASSVSHATTMGQGYSIGAASGIGAASAFRYHAGMNTTRERRGPMGRWWMAACAAVLGGCAGPRAVAEPPLAQELSALIAQPRSELWEVVTRYDADRGALLRTYAVESSPARRARMEDGERWCKPKF